MDDLLSYVLSNLDSAGTKQWPAVAIASGVPLDTVIKIGKGHTKNPRITTVQRLANHFRGQS